MAKEGVSFKQGAGKFVFGLKLFFDFRRLGVFLVPIGNNNGITERNEHKLNQKRKEMFIYIK